MKTYLTYDDVNIVPKYSELSSRKNVDLNTKLTKNIELQIPIVSSPMDTVTEFEMAIQMMELGGVGIIHRFNTIEHQVKMVNNVFKSLHDISIEEAKKYGLTWTPICAAVGVTEDYLERAKELVLNGCNVILIDVAHGHHKLVGEAIEKIKKNISGVEVIAGSVATAESCEYLCEKGADAIRVGIGNGSLCETRIRTGVGVPQVTALIDCVSIADTYNVPVTGLEMTAGLGLEGWGRSTWGNDAWGEQSTVNIEIGESLTGFEITASLGTPQINYDFIFTLSESLLGTLSLGSLTTIPDMVIGASGYAITASLGTVTEEVIYF